MSKFPYKRHPNKMFASAHNKKFTTDANMTVGHFPPPLFIHFLPDPPPNPGRSANYRCQFQKEVHSACLHESDQLAEDYAALPGDGDLPDDVRQDRYESDAEVHHSQVLDEEVHPALAALGHQQGNQDRGVSYDNQGQEDP